MTKSELIKLLEPFTDDAHVLLEVISVPPKKVWDGSEIITGQGLRGEVYNVVQIAYQDVNKCVITMTNPVWIE